MQNQSHVDRDGAKERLATAANVAGDKVASRLDTQKERSQGSSEALHKRCDRPVISYGTRVKQLLLQSM
jgi:hypothetical protein